MVRLAAVALVFSLAAGPAFAADGEQVFYTNCKLCHSPDPARRIAPSLQGVAGSARWRRRRTSPIPTR